LELSNAHHLRQPGDIGRDPPRLIARVRSILIYVKPTSLIWIKPDPFNPCSPYFMISFTYRFPRTGQNVHGHTADDLIGSSNAYEPVVSTACGATHFVNAKTGKLLEEAERV
jgi:hypothetical protein